MEKEPSGAHHGDRAVPDQVVMLRHGMGKNNWQEYQMYMETKSAILYGAAATVIRTGEAYQCPVPTAAELQPPIIEGVEYTQAMINKHIAEGVADYAKRQRAIAAQWPALFGWIMTTLSEESKVVVTAHASCAEATQTANPNLLWSIISATHASEMAGVPGMAAQVRHELITKVRNARQLHSETAAQFAARVRRAGKAITDANDPLLPAIEAEDLAMIFVQGLDTRFASMQAHLRNERQYPLSLHEAYVMASQWVTPAQPGRMPPDRASNFITADSRQDKTETRTKGRKDSRHTKERDGKDAGRGDTICMNCGADGHHHWQCHHELTSALKAHQAAREKRIKARSERKPKRAGVHYQGAREADVDEDAWLDEDYTFVILDHWSEALGLTTSDQRKSEVIFDSGAARSMFREANMLIDVREAEHSLTVHGAVAGRSVNIHREGEFLGFGNIYQTEKAAANLIAPNEMAQRGHTWGYIGKEGAPGTPERDVFWLRSRDGKRTLVFRRRTDRNGQPSAHYTWLAGEPTHSDSVGMYATGDPSHVATVDARRAEFTVSQNKMADEARRAQAALGGYSARATAEAIGQMTHCPITSADVARAERIYGPHPAAVVGGTKKRTGIPAVVDPGTGFLPVQQQQYLEVDLFNIRGIWFVFALMKPMMYLFGLPIATRSSKDVDKQLGRIMRSIAAKSITIGIIRSDNEGAMSKLFPRPSLQIDFCGPGEHVPGVERAGQDVKKSARGISCTLPWSPTKAIFTYLVLYCIGCFNEVVHASSYNRVSPAQLFRQRKTDYRAMVAFGTSGDARVPYPDNSMKPRTEAVINMLPVHDLTNSFRVYRIAENDFVTRTQVRWRPTTDATIALINSRAAADSVPQEWTIEDPTGTPADPAPDGPALPHLPTLLPAAMLQPDAPDAAQSAAGVADAVNDAVAAGAEPEADEVVEPGAGVEAEAGPGAEAEDAEPRVGVEHPAADEEPPIGVEPDGAAEPPNQQRRSQRMRTPATYREYVMLSDIADRIEAETRSAYQRAEGHADVYKLSIRQALQGEHALDARKVAEDEIQQLLDKKVFHGIYTKDLTFQENAATIRSSMFLKEKYKPSGEYTKTKGRLVAGGDQQDKTLFGDVSAPTASTTSVLIVAAIAAAEGRNNFASIDIGGAFLNAELPVNGPKIHMRLDKLLTSILVRLDPHYAQFVAGDGSCVVQLDRALYGTVQAAALWYKDLRSKLEADGFTRNPHDFCVFNKIGASGNQITIVLHVDDMLLTAFEASDIDDVERMLRTSYSEVTAERGKVLSYTGMTLDFTVSGQVSVTMDKLTADVIATSREAKPCATPATENLFATRDIKKLAQEDVAYFRMLVAKLLYLAKRTRPEILTAIAFLTTRVQTADTDDMAKLHRVVGYLKANQYRGIRLRVGEHMSVKAYIDAAYGVHIESGKSHTGCAVVIGDAGPVYVESSKQKIVTKASTESELVSLSDMGGNALGIKGFVECQGPYQLGPAEIYQDNLSTMALIEKGTPCSKRSRHIAIRHFWLKDRVDSGEAVIKYLSTEKMFANILTKPVQGRQFIIERAALTNWE